jgi:hypothetical protein
MIQRHVNFDTQSDESPDRLVQRLPLYLHTVLSVLRKMGPKDFCYEGAYSFLRILKLLTSFTTVDFQKKVTSHKFDLKQSSMLRLRFELLDSYLANKDNDITSFLKPGRMVGLSTFLAF